MPDVEALLRRVFAAVESLPGRTTDRTGAQGGQFEMAVLAPAAGELPARLVALGVPASTGYLGMLKILDPRGLFDALEIEAELERRGDGWCVRAAGLEAELAEWELVKLVFGPERVGGFERRVFPVGFYQWLMDRL